MPRGLVVVQGIVWVPELVQRVHLLALQGKQINATIHGFFPRNRRGVKSFEPRRLFRVPETQWRSSVPSVSSPAFTLACVVIDVLHCCDLGVSQDAVGNLFWYAIAVSTLLEGRTQAQRCSSLFMMIKTFYKEPTTRDNKLQNLTLEMVKRDKKSPKLRTKGGEMRALIPFAFHLAKKLDEHDSSVYTRTLVTMFGALLEFYFLMGSDAWDAKAAASACLRFCLQYKALSDIARAENGNDTVFWLTKPEFHMFQEIVEFQGIERGDPSLFWAYKDEDFVGWVATFAASRGGAYNCAVMAERTIQRYRGWVREL